MNNEIKKGKNFSLRGRSFIGKVISNKMAKTITVEWERRRKIPKYERYEKRRTRIHAHLPEGSMAEVGDMVKIMESRPISKTKTFVFVENLSRPVTQKENKENKNASS